MTNENQIEGGVEDAEIDSVVQRILSHLPELSIEDRADLEACLYEVYEMGCSQAEAENYNYGYADGELDGYDHGYDDGYQDGIEEGRLLSPPSAD